VTLRDNSGESRRIIAEFFKNSGVGLATIDRQLRFKMVNPYLAASNAASVECHLGKHLEDIVGESGAQISSLVERVFSTNTPELNWRISGVIPTTAQEKHWIGSYFPVVDSDGTVKQVAAVVVDLDFPVSLHLSQSNSDHQILRSWKDIARYLGTCVKTVQRWENKGSLPIRRVSEKQKGAAVFALSDEVDDWLRGRSSN
jgi:transcriptional regulator with PAS, ATPase and Fis domain